MLASQEGLCSIELIAGGGTSGIITRGNVGLVLSVIAACLL